MINSDSSSSSSSRQTTPEDKEEEEENDNDNEKEREIKGDDHDHHHHDSSTVNDLKIDNMSLNSVDDDPNNNNTSTTTTTTSTSTSTSTTTKTKLTFVKEKDFNSEEMIEHQLNQQSKQLMNSVKKKKEDFNFIRTIGKGSYGKVKLVVENSTGNLYAAKILNKQLIIKEKKAKYVNSEKTILDSLDHPNIIKLYYTFQDESNLYFIIEYCPNGDLLDQLKKSGNCFQMDVVRFYAAEILLAIEYLHIRGICHRDIKPENILLSKTMHTKLSDFGTAKVIHNERSGSFCGTAEYVCPELLVEKTAGKSADIWSYGCLLYQLICGKLPFKGFNEYQTFQLIIKRELVFPKSFDSVARSLVDRILCLDPKERPSFDEIKQHPFFAGINWELIYQQTPPKITIFEPISPMPSPLEEERQRSKSVGSPLIYQQQPQHEQPLHQQIVQKQRERATTTSSVQQSPLSISYQDNRTSSSSPLSPSLPLISSPSNLHTPPLYSSPSTSSSQVILRLSDLPKSYHPTIFVSPTDLLLLGKPKITQLLSEQSTLLWKQLLLPNDEVILGMTPIVKKTGLISKQRHLIITNSPRIFWVDSSKMVVKGEIQVDLTLTSTFKSNKHFTITSRGRTRHFYDMVTQDSKRWVDLINDLKLLGSG